MIYDLKRSVDLRWLFDPVLHSSFDDLVLCVLGDDYEWKRQEIAPENNIGKHNLDCSIQRSIISCCRGNLIHLRNENGPSCQDPINIIVLTLIAIQFINLVRAQQFFFFVWDYLSCRFQEILLSCNCKSQTSAQMRHSSFFISSGVTGLAPSCEQIWRVIKCW